MRVDHERLKKLVDDLFHAAGCERRESERIAHYLVIANLVGHDSHGVIRAPIYIDWLRKERVIANQIPSIPFETDSIAVVDGQFGFGQVSGEEAMKIGLAKCAKSGVAIVALRNAGHLGRIGDWAEMCANAGKVSLHFVNTSGGGILVAPFGGRERRLSANPIAAGIPVKDSAPIILDMSTCIIAEGKIKVAFNKGQNIPDGCILDYNGAATNDPKIFYADPPGVILPMAGHKGFSLGVVAEILAGALTGGDCSRPGVIRISNNMLTLILDPEAFVTRDYFNQEIGDFIEYVKSSKTIAPDGSILMPGEPEAQNRARRLRDGVELDDATWAQLRKTAEELNCLASMPA